MLDYQEEQGNPRDISVFERVSIAFQRIKGFNWAMFKKSVIFGIV